MADKAVIDNRIITNWDPVDIAIRAMDPNLPVLLNVRVTPDHAKDLSARTLKNRRALKRHFLRYAKAMAAKGWAINGETISFAPDGLNVNGWNRLAACVESKEAFDTCAAFNVDPDTYLTIDTGKVRSLAETLVSVNEDPELSGPLQFLYLLREEETFAAANEPLPKPRVPASTEQYIELFGNEPGMADSVLVSKDARKAPALHLLNHSAITVAHHVTVLQDAVRSAEFWPSLISGVSLGADDPRYALRNWHERNLRAGEPARTAHAFVALMRVWNLWRVDEQTRLNTFVYQPSDGLLVTGLPKSRRKGKAKANGIVSIDPNETPDQTAPDEQAPPDGATASE